MPSSIDEFIIQSRPRVALVVGCGGLNSLAAHPLIEFLEAHQIGLDLLVGCSGGSITLGLLASGHTAEEMMEILPRFIKPSLFPKNWRGIASMFSVLPVSRERPFSFFKTEPLLQAFETLYGGRRLEALPVPLVLQATDFETGEGVELQSGDLGKAVYASCAAYPFFPPIRIGGRWLCDGGFNAPVPVLAAVRRGANIILAMDFAEEIKPHPKTLVEALVHIKKVVGRTVTQSQMLASLNLDDSEIIIIKVRFPRDIQMWETSAFEQILEVGRRAVAEYGPEILALVRGLAPEGTGSPGLGQDPAKAEASPPISRPA